MSSRLNDAYQTLGLPQGSTLELVKKSHRDLVKQWHPDKFQESQQKLDATKRISEINAAYSYLTSIKRKSHNYTKSTTQRKPPNQNPTTPDSVGFKSTKESSKSTFDKKRRTQKKEPDFQFKQSKINSILSQLTRKRNLHKLLSHKKKHNSETKRIIEKERESWVKLRTKYDERTRIGLYRSFFNAVFFGRIIHFTSSSNLPGNFTIRDKYEIDLRHNLINDQLFYAINKGLNIILKNIIGFFTVVLFLYITLLHYGFGIIKSIEAYMLIEIGVLFQASLLFIPDNLFQRSMLWKYRHLEKREIQETFKNRTFPKTVNRIKHIMLSLKYILLFAYMYWFITGLEFNLI